MRGPCPQCEDQYRALCQTCALCQEHCQCEKSKIENQTPPDLLWAEVPATVSTCQSDQPVPPSGITLMAVVSKHHPTWTTVCDGRCHDSTAPVCICLCQGAFHGLKTGSTKLAAMIKQHGPVLVKRWKELGVDCSGLEAEIKKLEVTSMNREDSKQ